ncbi:NfeD family protein [Actinotalea sp.]|uniref:NfeD family protein n=1 Tax=Actinotalea sp. TaxID=1872145 RepID=UPI003565AE16
MIVFVVIGAVGLAVLLLSLLLGDLVEFGDGDVSGTSLGAGAVAFGAIGTIVTANGLPIVWAYVASAVFGALVVLGVQRLVRRLRETEDGVGYTVVGVSGVVTATVVPNGAGEVSLDDPRELERRLAWADTEITVGARVVVVEQAGSRVKVEPAERLPER